MELQWNGYPGRAAQRRPVMFWALAVGFLGLWLCGFTGCGRPQPALAGMYVNAAGSAVSEARDTLVVELEKGNSFLLHRRTGYRLVMEHGGFSPWKYEKEEWRAVYDPSTGVMTEVRHGKLITFDLERGVMSVGKRQYERVGGK